MDWSADRRPSASGANASGGAGAAVEASVSGWASAFRIELRVQAIELASRGWSVLPGTYPAGYEAGVPVWSGSEAARPSGATHPVPVHADWQERLGADVRQVANWWSEEPYSLLVATVSRSKRSKPAPSWAGAPRGHCARWAFRSRSWPPPTPAGTSSPPVVPLPRRAPSSWRRERFAGTAPAAGCRFPRALSTTASCTGGSSRRSAGGGCRRPRSSVTPCAPVRTPSQTWQNSSWRADTPRRPRTESQGTGRPTRPGAPPIGAGGGSEWDRRTPSLTRSAVGPQPCPATPPCAVESTSRTATAPALSNGSLPFPHFGD